MPTTQIALAPDFWETIRRLVDTVNVAAGALWQQMPRNRKQSHSAVIEDYVEYLELNLIQTHCQVGDRVSPQPSVDPQVKGTIITQIHALKAHRLAGRGHCIALVPFLGYCDPDIANAADAAFDYLHSRPPADWLALCEETERANAPTILSTAPAVAWDEISEQRFRELVRLEATGRISRSGRDELDQLADSRRKTLSPMPVDEAALQDQRLASLRKVLGALEDYVKGFTSTNSPRPGA